MIPFVSLWVLAAGDRDPNPDLDLLERAASGDRDAFGELFRKYADRVYRVARRMCSNDDDAWDVTQDAFLRAMEAMDRFDTRFRFFTWMYRITTNLAINLARKKKRRSESVFDESVGRGDRERLRDDVAESEEAGRLARAVDRAVEKLTPSLRAVFVLRVDRRMSYTEIAESLDIPLGTVMSRLNRARAAVRKELGALLEEYE